MFLTGEERWKVLRLHVEDQISLAALARETGNSTRTLQRWLRLYRAGGASALDLRPRADAGTRRLDVLGQDVG
ncbi:helix-turn-helix domain-containing protein, partial [Arthrobacter oryzae]